MEVPVYKITVKEDDINSGVDYVALVDSPAILRNFLAFGKHEKFSANDELKVVSGPLMIPEIPIYRRDDAGEFYVVFDRATIYTIAKKFMKELRNDKVNQMHQPDQKVGGVYMFESFFIDSSRGINTPKGFEHLPDGTWFGSYKIDNDEVWAKVKDGTFNGFSVEGFFDLNMERVTDDALLHKVIDVIKNGKVNKQNNLTLRNMDASKVINDIKKILFGEIKFMDAVLKGADGNEINAVVDGELIPGVAINVDGKPVMDGDYEINGNMVTTQGGLIVTVTPLEAEMKQNPTLTAEAKAEIMNQIAALEAKLSEIKPFDSTELKESFNAQITELKNENKILTDSVKQLLQVVEQLSKEPADKSVASKKDAFKIQKEKEQNELRDLANTISKLTKNK